MVLSSMCNKTGQSCINAALQKISTQIDSCNTTDTKQDFHVFEYNGYLKPGQTILLDKPLTETDVYVDINNTDVCIGRINNNGLFTVGCLNRYIVSSNNNISWQKSLGRPSATFYSLDRCNLCIGVYCTDSKEIEKAEYRYYGGTDCIAFYDVCNCPVYKSECIKCCNYTNKTCYIGNCKIQNNITTKDVLEFYAPYLDRSWYFGSCISGLTCPYSNYYRGRNTLCCGCTVPALNYGKYGYCTNAAVYMSYTGLDFCLNTVSFCKTCEVKDLYGCKTCIPIALCCEDIILMTNNFYTCCLLYATNCFEPDITKCCYADVLTLKPLCTSWSSGSKGEVYAYINGVCLCRCCGYPPIDPSYSYYICVCRDGSCYNSDALRYKYCGIFSPGTHLGSWNTGICWYHPCVVANDYVCLCLDGCLSKKGTVVDNTVKKCEVSYYGIKDDNCVQDKMSTKYKYYSAFQPNTTYIGCLYNDGKESLKCLPAEGEDSWSPLSMSIGYSDSLYNCLYKKTKRYECVNNTCLYSPARVCFGNITWLCYYQNSLGSACKCFTYIICSNPVVYERFSKVYTVKQVVSVLTDLSKCCLSFRFYYR